MAKKTTAAASRKSAGTPEAVTSGSHQPDVTVRVAKGGHTIIYEDKAYTSGDTLSVPNRTAEHWVLAGQVEVTQ